MKLSGGSVDERLEGQFKDITRTILENQNEALGNLTSKVCHYNSNIWTGDRKNSQLLILEISGT